MLTSTVMVPIYGKLNDIYGRKSVLVFGISVFILGSALCGMAGEFGRLPLLGGGMTQLIVFRAIQGLGGAALFTTAFAIIADLFGPRERAKFGGLFGSMFGLAAVIGPVLGGFFTDLGTTYLFGVPIAGWRWCFYVNLPVGALSLFMILSKMPPLIHRDPGKIDVAGALLIVVTFVPLLLALGWGGRDYAWGSPLILSLLGVSAVGLVAFILTEMAVSNPILSLNLFRNRVFTGCNLASFTISIAFMGSLTFLPLLMQLGQGKAATTSGLTMLPMMIGMFGSSSICGLIAAKTGRYKPLMVGGGVMMLIGLFAISKVNATTSTLDLGWRILITGIGLGPSMSLFSLAVQNAVSPTQIGVATSSSQFFRQIGGTVGVAIFGAILTNNLAAAAARPDKAGHVQVLGLSDLQRMAVGAAGEGAPSVSTSSRAHAAPPVKVDPAVRDVVVKAITGVFTWGWAVLVLALGLILMIPEIPLVHRGRGPAAPKKDEDEPAPAA